VLKIKSGHSLPYILEINVLNDNHELADDINDEYFEVSLRVNDPELALIAKLIGVTKIPIKRGRAVLKQEFLIIGKPNYSGSLLFQSDPTTSILLGEANVLMNEHLSYIYIGRLKSL